MTMNEAILDVAIVGGGVAGIYSGWRLMGADQPPGATLGSAPIRRVALFELSDRIGGRLLSVTPPGMPNVRCELGGMRYISTQKLCRSLVENVLKLEVHDFPTSLSNNLCYLRGKRLRFADIKAAINVPYNLEQAEHGLNPGELLLLALRQLVPGIDAMNDQQFDDIYRNFKFEGHHLWQLGFWNLLLRAVSSEAYEFIQDSSGYYSITTNWNAGDALRMCLADFAPGVAYHGINDGFETVPQLMCAGFEKAGGKVHYGQRLVSFDSTVLADGSKGVSLQMASVAGTVTVLARHLVLALPRRSIELLSPTGCLLDPGNKEVRALIRSVTGIALFKIFVAYHAPWWEAVGVTQGQSTTTLPLRQCYYWGVEGRQKGADPTNHNAVLLASYQDVRETAFWRGFENRTAPGQPMYAEQANRFATADAAHGAWRHYQAPRLMVEETHRELLELHGVRHAPKPYAATYRDWLEDPYGGGIHFWNVGYSSIDCIPKMVKPMANEPVYVVGEAYSRSQGWVEGALETSELMLAALGVSKPGWVTTAP